MWKTLSIVAAILTAGAAFFSYKNHEQLKSERVLLAIAQANQILTNAEAAAKADRERLGMELKREFGRLVAATTAQVTGKVLTADDQQRINEDVLVKIEG